MEKILKYSVLRYSPSTVAGEKINLGIIFYDEESNFREFKYTKKFSRLTSFDDEIDLNLVKKLLLGIRDEVVGNLFTYEKFDIDKYTEYFINDFCFDKPKMIKYDNIEDIVERLNKIYFRFEYDKKERPSKADDKKIIEQLISAKGKEVKKDEYIYGSCNEKIKYDFVTEDYNIKIFDFDGKNLNKLINSAKTWAWNCMYNDKGKSVIIYRYSEENAQYNAEFKIIMDIFKKAQTTIYDIEEGMQWLQANN